MGHKRPDAETRARLLHLLLDESKSLKENLSRAFFSFADNVVLAKMLVEAHVLSCRLFYNDATKAYEPATLPTILRAVTEARTSWQAERDEREARYEADVARLAASNRELR